MRLGPALVKASSDGWSERPAVLCVNALRLLASRQSAQARVRAQMLSASMNASVGVMQVQVRYDVGVDAGDACTGAQLQALM